MQSIPWLRGKFHIPEALWRKYQYLELYPLDGGASFIVDEFARTRNDEELTKKLMSGELLQKWGTPGHMDWYKHGETRNLELHAWLQRWYFVASAARTYFLHHDEAPAEIIFRLLADWERQLGYPQTKEAMVKIEEEALAFDYKFQRDLLPSREVHVPWEWYDFQPANRLIVLLASTQLLQGSKALQANSGQMLEYIAGHANSILWVTRHYGYKYGNHHTLRMMALYLAGMLIKHENADLWRNTALEMQTRHISEDFFEDGMYKESLPGYVPFVVTHFREVLLSATANGQQLPEIFEKTVCRTLALLKGMVMPDGYLPVINDGPRVNITGMLDLMEHYYPVPRAQAGGFQVNQPSGFSVFHDERNYLIFDANYAHGTHVQAGKLGFILWHGQEPFIIEAGCCNYDHPDFQPYFRRGQAHSTLLVDDQEDAVWKSFWVWAERAHPVITDFTEGAQPSVRAESDGFKRLGIAWARRIEHPALDSFVITDEIANASKTARKFTFRFMMAQKDVQVDQAQNTVRVKSDKHTLTLRASLKAEIQLKEVTSNFFGDMRSVPCVDFVVKAADNFKQTFTLTFEAAARAGAQTGKKRGGKKAK